MVTDTSSFVLVALTFSVHRPLLSTIFHGFLSALLHLLLQYINVLSATSALLWEILSLPIRHSLREIPHLCHESGLFAIAVHYDQLAIFLTLSDIASDISSDISSDILYEKSAPCAKIGLLETMIEWTGGMMTKLSETELKMLVKGGETNTVELKLAAPRAVDLAERLCGMANARGGILIIGVEDSTRKVVGVPDERIGETMDVILRAARQIIRPELVLNPPEPEVYMLSGKKLLVATILPTDGPVYQAGGIFWIRQGTQTRALSMAELSEMIYDRGLRDWELEAAYNATMEDIDLEKVKSFIAQRSSSGRQSGRFKDRERVLIGMRCALEVSSGTIVPTNAGMLFFGHSPQDHIPQSEVVCVLFRESVGASRYADRKIVTGTLQDVIDNTEAFLNRYIAVGARIEGWKRIDIPEYSIEVLREAVINAVVHRDYSKRGERVRVFYYPDRVEVHSPGLLLPGITVEQMERGEVQSKLRNPVLGGLLSSIPGYMEQIGSGVRFMLDETKRMGLPAPQFRQMGEFIVTFYSAPALHAPQPQLQYKGETLWEENEDSLPEIVVQNRHAEQIEKRLIKALNYVQEHGFITNGIYRQLTGVTDRTAHRDLEKLVERGRLKGTGQRAARRYVLA